MYWAGIQLRREGSDQTHALPGGAALERGPLVQDKGSHWLSILIWIDASKI